MPIQINPDQSLVGLVLLDQPRPEVSLLNLSISTVASKVAPTVAIELDQELVLA